MENNFFSKVVIGTWSLSGDFGKVEKKNIFKSIEAAIRNNFFEFDTAPTYGNGKIYEILKDIIGNEKKIKINTKCGYNLNSIKTFNPSDIEKSIDFSLNKFKKINTIFLHNPRNEIKNWQKIIDILNWYKKKKYIKNIGISLARDFYFNENIMNQFDYLQDEINLLRPQSIFLLKKFKPKIMARSPLASGCLSGKLNINSKFLASDYRARWLSDKKRLKNILFQVAQISKITGKNIKQFSKIFLLKNKLINKVIFGIKKPSHVNELLEDINKTHSLDELKVNKVYELANLKFNLRHSENGY